MVKNEVINESNVGKKLAGTIIIGFALLVAVILLFNSVVIVPAGSRGVLLEFGAVKGTLSEGIHLVVPVIDDVKKVSVQTQKFTAECSSASKDLQTVATSVALNYHLNAEEVGDVYKNIGLSFEDRIIQPAIQESVKSATAKYNAEELITQREAVKSAIELNIKERLANYGIYSEAVSITNFDFSAQFNNAIEQKMVANQLKLKADYDLQRIQVEAEQTVTKAQAEATALQLQGTQLATTPEVLQLRAIEKWNGVMPVFMSNGGNSVTPFVDINSLMNTTG